MKRISPLQINPKGKKYKVQVHSNEGKTQQTGKDRNENVDFGALEGDTGERHEVNQRGRVKKKQRQLQSGKETRKVYKIKQEVM